MALPTLTSSVRSVLVHARIPSLDRAFGLWVLLAVALPSAIRAQCPRGNQVVLVPWNGSSFVSTWPVDDEGLTATPISLSPPFAMPGAAGTLDQLWVNSNGDLYLTDAAMALAGPVAGAVYGIDTLPEMRGVAPGGSARIAVCGGDHEASVAPLTGWSVTVDQSVAGQTTVTWTDVRSFGGTPPERFNFRATLFQAPGAVTIDYGTSFPTGFADRYVGISIGGGVGSTATPSSDLSATPDSGTMGLLFQAFTPTGPDAWDLSGQSLTLTPNGLGGYTAAPLLAYTPPDCAFIKSYGVGCPSSAPLTLVSDGRPVITLGGQGPSLPIAITALNVPDAAPPSGIGLGILFCGFTMFDPGIDLASLGIDMPGCNLHTTPEILLPFTGSADTVVAFLGSLPQPLSPGLRIEIQALAIAPGVTAIGMVVSNGLKVHPGLE